MTVKQLKDHLSSIDEDIEVYLQIYPKTQSSELKNIVLHLTAGVIVFAGAEEINV